MTLEYHQFRGSLRVGRITYQGGKAQHPSYPDYTSILVLTKSSPYGSLGPYVLKDDEGRIMENIWQFSKVYDWVPYSRQVYSRWDSTVIWEHPKEVHADKKGVLNDAYWAWREKGMRNSEAVRYPVGNGEHRALCKYVLKEKDGPQLGIAEGRKEVYLATYTDLVKREEQFRDLQERLKFGENLLIIEVDGPHEEDLDYYRKTYGVGQDFIQLDSIEVNLKNMEIMLNDTKHSFGHGYCLAISLLDWPPEMLRIW